MFKAITSFLRIGVFAALMSLLVAPALAKGGEAVHVLQAHWEAVNAVAFSPDGKYAASGDFSGEVIIWNVGDGSRHFLTKWGGEFTAGLEFSPDGKDLFVAKQQAGGGTLARYSIKKKERLDDTIITKPLSLAISPDGKYLTFGEHGSNDVQISKSKDFSPVTRLTGHKKDVVTIRYSADGESIGTIALNGSLVVWDANDGIRKFQIKAGSEGSFFDVSFRPDGQHIAYIEAGVVDIANALTGKLVQNDFSKPVLAPLLHGFLEKLAYHPDGHLIAASSSNGSIYLLDAETGGLLGELSGEHEGSILSLTFSRDGSMLISGGYDNRVVIWRLD